MVDDEDRTKDTSKDDSYSADDKSGGVSDTLKKILSTGIAAAFMTEESVRSYLKEIRLPKDVLHLLLQGANKSKEELVNAVTNELVTVIKKIDFVKEASRFVEEHKFRVTAEIEVVRKTSNDQAASDIKTKIEIS